MNRLLACRVCLAHDIRLCSIMDGQFRDIYEKLVEASLDTEDMLPTAVCYICFASMKKMLQFRDRSQKANQILQRMISSGLELSVSSLDMLVKEQRGISWSLRISDIERTTTTSAEDEVRVKIESVESEMGIDRMSDTNEAAGLARTPIHPFPGGIPVPYPISLSPEMSETKPFFSHKQHILHTPSMDPISSAASGFQSPYPTSLPIPSSSLKRSLGTGSSSSASDKPAESSATNSKEQNKNVEEFATTTLQPQITEKPHIKKPLNAFMLYMKDMRAKVVAECTLKESAAISQILGRRWRSLSREEQAKYFEKARQERQLHMQLYPDWLSTQCGKKRRRGRKKTIDPGNYKKKCRARYGLDQQNQWCEPCRRKKKCARYMKALAAATGSVSLPMVMPQALCSENVKLEELSDASDDDGIADTPLNSASSPSSDPPPAPRHPVGTNPRDANNPLSVSQLLRAFRTGMGKYTRPLSPKYMSN